MKKEQKTVILQTFLFVITFIVTTVAGTEWLYGRLLIDPNADISWFKISRGLLFSVPFIGILTIHEFGHYFVARIHKVKVSLPYYIPLWLGFLGIHSIGSMGAFIRIRSASQTNKEYFDIGIAGPLAGFAAAFFVLYYGFTHLPPKDYIFTIFPEFIKYGQDYIKKLPEEWEVFALGDNLMFMFFEKYIADPKLVPPHYELMHHPVLFAGYLSLVFTSLNLLPIGQLDGGHILYGLVGPKLHLTISRILFILFIFYSGIGVLNPRGTFDSMLISLPLYLLYLYNAFYLVFETAANRLMAAVLVLTGQFLIVYFFPGTEGNEGWLLFTLIIGRFLGIRHPETVIEKISTGRKILGWVSLLIFILCFTPKLFYIP